MSMAPASNIRRRSRAGSAAVTEDATSTGAGRSNDDPTRTISKRAVTTHGGSMTFWRAFVVLAIARGASAVFNLVHDCDESFNFWEPLHYLVHGHGLQTWEHSPEYALRSYLYLGIHYAVAKPISWLTGDGQGKLFTFIGVRMVLGMASAGSEAWLCAEMARVNALAGTLCTALLAWSAGMFAASTAFLPSTFAMYCITTAAAATLRGWHSVSCGACVVAVVWGWPFAGIAAVPYGLDALVKVGFVRTMVFVIVPLLVSAALAVAVDSFFYGRLTWSTVNILRYNVAGGGSNLYGVEPPTFYLRNLFNAFTLALPLALAAPAIALVAAATDRSTTARHVSGFGRLAVAYAPFPLSLAFFSTVAHKEERFMYVVYPLLCVGAAIALAAAVDVAAKLRRRLNLDGLTLVAALGAAATTLVVLVLSLSRVVALTQGYGAPMFVYPSLPVPTIPGGGENVTLGVCVGGEWYRFPSSFLLPSPAYRLRFIDSSFDGALPVPFDASAGGTRYAPSGLNDRNEADPRQRVPNSDEKCQFIVDVNLKGVKPAVDPSQVAKRKLPTGRIRGTWAEMDGDELSGGAEDEADGAAWEIVQEVEFLDQANSPPVSRAFYFPGWSYAKNTYGTYRLLRRTHRS